MTSPTYEMCWVAVLACGLILLWKLRAYLPRPQHGSRLATVGGASGPIWVWILLTAAGCFGVLPLVYPLSKQLPVVLDVIRILVPYVVLLAFTILVFEFESPGFLTETGVEIPPRSHQLKIPFVPWHELQRFEWHGGFLMLYSETSPAVDVFCVKVRLRHKEIVQRILIAHIEGNDADTKP